MSNKLRGWPGSKKFSINIMHTISEFSVEFLIVFSFFLISTLFFYFLVRFVIPENQNAIDNLAWHYFKPAISATNIKIAECITFFGTGTFLIPCYGIIILYLRRKKLVKYSMMVSTMAISSMLLGWVLKALFHRTRPADPLVNGAGGYSFPSGHALGGFIFSGVLLFLVWKTKLPTHGKWIWSIIVAAFGLAIGLSRIYLHVHYATDVIGSFFVTLSWFSLMFIFFRFIFGRDISGIESNSKMNFDNYELYN